MKLFRKNKKGFTLVELMIVVVILGILVAIAVPIYNSFTTDAQANADDANIRTLQSMVLQISVAEGVDQEDIDLNTEVNATTYVFESFDVATADHVSKIGTKAATNDAIKTMVFNYIVEWPTSPIDGFKYVVQDGIVASIAHNTEATFTE